MATQMNDTLIALNEPVGPYELHEALYEAFVPTGHARDFIFAPAMINDAPAVIVRGERDGAPVPVPVATQESRFMLRAWPTVKLNGRPRSIAARPDKDGLRLRWLQRRAEEHGFELIGEPSMTVEPFTVDRPGRRFGGNAVIYQGWLRVTDPVRFTQALREGIGAGRAWGLGLLMLFPSGEEEKKHGDVAD